MAVLLSSKPSAASENETYANFMEKKEDFAARPSRVLSISPLAEVSHDEAKMRDIFASSCETSASREALDLL